MIFNNESANEVNTDVNWGGTTQLFPNGWYKIAITAEGEEKPAKSGTSQGQLFTFTVMAGEHTGKTFSVWFCSRAVSSDKAWMEDRTRAFFARVAQVCGIARLSSTQSLHKHPFAAYLVRNKSVRKVVDPETEEIRDQEREQMDFGPGKISEIILSVSEFVEKFKAAETAPRKFVKAARTRATEPVKPAAAAEETADAPAEEVPW